MTTPKTGNISLNAVRSDLGLGPGSLTDRAVCNRAGFSTAAKPSLEDHRGIACCPQALITGGINAPMTRRDTGYQGMYPDSTGEVTAFELNDQVRVQCRVRAGGADPEMGVADAGREYRVNTFVPNSTRLGVTGSVALTQDTDYNNFNWQIAIVANKDGYLVGDDERFLGLDFSKYDKTNIDIVTTSTPASHPYISLILYINGEGGSYANGPQTATFYNMVMSVL